MKFQIGLANLNKAQWIFLGLLVASGILSAIVANSIGVAQRWEWWTRSANDLGALAAIGCILCGGFGYIVASRGRFGVYSALIITVLLIGYCCFMAGLMGSCSRGGLLALFSGSLLLCVFSHQLRVFAVCAIVSLILSVWFVPRASERAAINPTTDTSISIRTDLIRASLAMIHDAPGGWGGDKFGDTCERWYLAEYRGMNMWHPLNDVLWIGSERGSVAMGAYIVIVFAVIFALLGSSSVNLIAAPIAGGIFAFFTAGNTTGLLRPDGIHYILIGLVIAGIVLLALTPRFRMWYKWGVYGIFFGLLCVASILALASMQASKWPLRAGMDSGVVSCVPRSKASDITVVVVKTEVSEMNSICRQVARCVVEAGFTTVCLSESDKWPESINRSSAAVICLRGVDASGYGGGLLRALIMVDPVQETKISTERAYPILAIMGTESFQIKIPSVASIKDVEVMAKMPYCWPKHFLKYSNEVIEFLKECDNAR